MLLRVGWTGVFLALLLVLAGPTEAVPVLLNGDFASFNCSNCKATFNCWHDKCGTCSKFFKKTGACTCPFLSVVTSGGADHVEIEAEACHTGAIGCHSLTFDGRQNGICAPKGSVDVLHFDMASVACPAISCPDGLLFVSGRNVHASETLCFDIQNSAGGGGAQQFTRTLTDTGGVITLCVDGTLVAPTNANIVNCFECFSVDFISDACNGKIDFIFSDKVAIGATSAAHFSVHALGDPQFSINPLASAAPEMDPTSVQTPLALVLAGLCILADRRRRPRS